MPLHADEEEKKSFGPGNTTGVTNFDIFMYFNERDIFIKEIFTKTIEVNHLALL